MVPQPFVDESGTMNALIALGSNVTSTFGPPIETLMHALAQLESDSVQVLHTSRFFATPCMPKGAGPDYINAAAHLRTCLGPEDLLGVLHAIEAEFDRRRTNRWAARTLDLDLLDYAGLTHPDKAAFLHWQTLPPEEQIKTAPDRMILPHPRIQDRAFVLVPLADIAPEWRHPVLGVTVSRMIAALAPEDVADVTPAPPPLANTRITE
jgi:2-amino-4-hydroxy-6-hydroxymethyldihydropteridine diphosphokinase